MPGSCRKSAALDNRIEMLISKEETGLSFSTKNKETLINEFI